MSDNVDNIDNMDIPLETRRKGTIDDFSVLAHGSLMGLPRLISRSRSSQHRIDEHVCISGYTPVPLLQVDYIQVLCSAETVSDPHIRVIVPCIKLPPDLFQSSEESTEQETNISEKKIFHHFEDCVIPITQDTIVMNIKDVIQKRYPFTRISPLRLFYFCHELPDETIISTLPHLNNGIFSVTQKGIDVDPSRHHTPSQALYFFSPLRDETSPSEHYLGVCLASVVDVVSTKRRRKTRVVPWCRVVSHTPFSHEIWASVWNTFCQTAPTVLFPSFSDAIKVGCRVSSVIGQLVNTPHALRTHEQRQDMTAIITFWKRHILDRLVNEIDLRPYQVQVAHYLDRHAGVLLYHEAGTGKTLTSLTTAVRFLLSDENNVVVITAPKSTVDQVWRHSIQTYVSYNMSVSENKTASVTTWIEKIDLLVSIRQRLVVLSHGEYTEFSQMTRETAGMSISLDEFNRHREQDGIYRLYPESNRSRLEKYPRYVRYAILLAWVRPLMGRRRVMTIVDEAHNFKADPIATLPETTTKAKTPTTTRDPTRDICCGSRYQDDIRFLTGGRCSSLTVSVLKELLTTRYTMILNGKTRRVKLSGSYFLRQACVQYVARIVFLTATPIVTSYTDIRNIAQDIILVGDGVFHDKFDTREKQDTMLLGGYTPDDLRVKKFYLEWKDLPRTHILEKKAGDTITDEEISLLRGMIHFQERGDSTQYPRGVFQIKYVPVPDDSAYSTGYKRLLGLYSQPTHTFDDSYVLPLPVGFQKEFHKWVSIQRDAPMTVRLARQHHINVSVVSKNKKANEFFTSQMKNAAFLYPSLPCVTVKQGKRKDTKKCPLGLPKIQDWATFVYSPKVSFLQGFSLDTKRTVIYTRLTLTAFFLANILTQFYPTIRTDMIHGATPNREQVATRFNDMGDGVVLIITKAGTEGVNLKRVSDVIFFDQVWTQSEYDQIVGRGIRYMSHSMLPPEKQVVTVTELIMFPTGQSQKRHNFMFYESWVYDSRQRRKKVLDTFQTALKKHLNRKGFLT